MLSIVCLCEYLLKVIVSKKVLKSAIIWLKVGKCSLEPAQADLILGCKKWATLLPTFTILS